MTSKTLTIGLFILYTLTGCGGGSSNDTPKTAAFSLAITDGPIESASAVVISFTEVELKPANGSSVTLQLDSAATLNLLDYQGQISAPLVQNAMLPTGEYNWVRLGVDQAASYIEIDGAQYPLEIPSSAQTGLKLNQGFTLAAGGVNAFTLDFDLRKSVHQEGTGDYKLRPTVRMVDNLEVGTVEGTVAANLIETVTCENNGANNDMGNLVYLFQGADTPVNDIQGQATDPLTTAIVSYEETSMTYQFEIGFVAAGDYTAAFTCDGQLDDAQTADMINFSNPVSLTVTAKQNTSVAFE